MRVDAGDPHGFCVLRVKARGQRDLVTVVGAAAMISAGEFVQASGACVNDRTHGLQFKAISLWGAQWVAFACSRRPALSRRSP